MPRTPRMDQIEALLADEPNDPFLRYGLAMEHSGQGDDATAVKMLRELIALDPAKPYIPAFLMCGQALVRLGKEGEAADLLKQGIDAATKAGTPDALHARGEMQGLLATVE
jgi:predicted Zn-dependent protease